MSVQEICRAPQQYKQEIHSNFSGFLEETQKSITTAMEEVPRMPVSEAKKAEVLRCLTQEKAALHTLAKASTVDQFDSSMTALTNQSQKLAQVKEVTRAFAKANLAATTGMLYAGIRMDELEGYNLPNKAAMNWVKFMDQQHAFVKANDLAYSSSKSHKLNNAIHNFYTCGTSNTKDTASKSRDMSKESSMVPQQNKQYQDSTYRAIKTAGKS